MRTRADADGAITGTKQWITNGSHAHTFIVFARDPDDAHRRVRRAPRRARASRVTREEEKLGLNSSSTADLALRGHARPSGSARPGAGMRIALSTLDGGRIGIAAQAVGHRPGGARRRRRLRQGAPRVRPPDRRLRRDPAEARRHADRDRGGARAHLARRAAEGGRPPAHRRGRAGQAVRLARRAPLDRRGDPGPRRLRLHQGVPGRALLPRRQGHRDLRGHERDPAARHRPRAARRGRARARPPERPDASPRRAEPQPCRGGCRRMRRSASEATTGSGGREPGALDPVRIDRGARVTRPGADAPGARAGVARSVPRRRDDVRARHRRAAQAGRAAQPSRCSRAARSRRAARPRRRPRSDAVDEASPRRSSRVLEVGLAQDAAARRRPARSSPRRTSARSMRAVAQHRRRAARRSRPHAGRSCGTRARSRARIEPLRASTVARLHASQLDVGEARRVDQPRAAPGRPARAPPRGRSARLAAERRQRGVGPAHLRPRAAVGDLRARRRHAVRQLGGQVAERSARDRACGSRLRAYSEPRPRHDRRRRDARCASTRSPRRAATGRSAGDARAVAARWRRSRRSCAPSRCCMARLNELLRPHGLTFPRYEALMLLSFTRAGALPLRQDRRAPAGPPHVGDQHRRQARGRRARAPRAPRRGPARDAGRDHRRAAARARAGGHRGRSTPRCFGIGALAPRRASSGSRRSCGDCASTRATSPRSMRRR